MKTVVERQFKLTPLKPEGDDAAPWWWQWVTQQIEIEALTDNATNDRKAA